MKYYIIAGEASGDLHASNLMKELRLRDQEASFRCWGGDLMQEQGGFLVKHYRDLAFMGFLEVLLNLKTILRNLKFCKNDILEYQPDVLILVDYPGFNLRIAEFAHEKNIRVFYYISPQVWAWKKSRVHKIKRDVDRMFVILPFEKDFYRSYDYPVDFVGHPLLDALPEDLDEEDRKIFTGRNGLEEKPIIALLPGSRRQEVSAILRVMLKIISDFPDHQFVIAAAPSLPKEFYEKITGSSRVKIVYRQMHSLLRFSDAALVTSGTATLETALMNVPEVVCYKGNVFSYSIARSIVKIKYISLVNLIMDKMVVKELIQYNLTPDNLREELISLIYDNTYRTRMLRNFKLLREKLGGKGASANAAEKMVECLKVNK
ncbi:MAG: lipid-A-disaccharide synthase [Bacteroidetes bacterium]|nr:lipid-A-disaccharide synthase [Bacteroidota bacterium]